MKYIDGVEIKVGDRVKLWQGCFGIVVSCLDSGEYSPRYSKNDWGYLKSGILVETDKAGLVHYLRRDEDMEFISRELE